MKLSEVIKELQDIQEYINYIGYDEPSVMGYDLDREIEPIIEIDYDENKNRIIIEAGIE